MFSTDQTSHARWIADFILAHRLEKIGTRDIVRSYRPFRPPEAKAEMLSVMQTLVSIGCWNQKNPPTCPSLS